MNFVELLLHNWFFVLLVIVSFLSWLNKRTGRRPGNPHPGGRRPSPPKPRAPMPPFGGGSPWAAGKSGDGPLPAPKAHEEHRRPARSPFRGPGAKAARPPAPPMESSAAGNNEPRDAASPREMTAPPREAHSTPSGAAGERPAPEARTRPASAAGPGLDPYSAVQGFLWSEVLGPPRAKNPYRKRC